MESTLQKFFRILISNVFAIIVFWVVIEFGQNINLASIERWELPLAMVITYLIILDYKIIKNKA